MRVFFANFVNLESNRITVVNKIPELYRFSPIRVEEKRKKKKKKKKKKTANRMKIYWITSIKSFHYLMF